jgi:cysteine protease ATG4
MHQSDIDDVSIQEREIRSKSTERMIVNKENNRMMNHHDHNESTFGAFGNEQLDDDGQNMVGDKELVNVAWKSSRKSQTITKEYGFDYEYNDHDSNEDDDDDDDDNKNENGDQKESLKDQFIAKLAASINVDIQTNNNPNNISYSINLLGKKYHPILDYTLRREDETNLFWFSYRCDFTEIKPEGITSDAGWGCMLRSAQMLIGQALRVHYCGRQWKAPKSNVRRRGDPFMQDLMMWLADFPSACTGCWYSLHNMVAAGLTRYDVLPGEWFGPGTACHVLRDLSELHERAWQRKYRNEPSVSSTTDTTTKLRMNNNNNNNQLLQYQRDLKPVMRVYVAPEGSIYRLEVDKLMTKDNKKNTTEESKSREDEPDNDDDGYDKVDFDALLEDPLLHPLSDIEQKESREEIPWDNSLLILLPLRLGLKTFNASKYKVPLSHVLSFPQSVGFLGGSPRHALWFYGANSDGSKVYGLDPHTVQRAPTRRRLRPEEELRTGNTKQYQVQLSDEYLRSLNAPNISSMDMSRIDPSLALGFYCRDRADFESLCAAVDDMKTNEVTKDFPALISFADARPDYNADLSSAMMDMMMGGSSSQMDEEEDNDDDEDDFVLI